MQPTSVRGITVRPDFMAAASLTTGRRPSRFFGGAKVCAPRVAGRRGDVAWQRGRRPTAACQSRLTAHRTAVSRDIVQRSWG